MRFCYIDESFSGDRQWFFLAGFVVSVEDAVRLGDEITRALSRDAIEKMDTLKDLRAGSTFSISRRNQLSDDLYQHLGESIDYKVFCVILQDSDGQKDEEDLHFGALHLMLERLDYLWDREGEHISVYTDSHSHSSEIQERHFQLQQRGTMYRDLEGIAGVAAPISDELSYGIQMADLIAAGIRAHFLGIESRYYTNYILPHVDRHPAKGTISGVGIKLVGDHSGPSLEYDIDRTSF